MNSITPQPGQIKEALQNTPSGVPVVMLNLLRFSDKAHYEEGASELSGQEAYGEYIKGAMPCIKAVGGELIWSGSAKGAFIAPQGEQWDQVLLIRYPAIESFLEMIGSDEYKAVVGHRTAALDDSRLVATVAD